MVQRLLRYSILREFRVGQRPLRTCPSTTPCFARCDPSAVPPTGRNRGDVLGQVLNPRDKPGGEKVTRSMRLVLVQIRPHVSKGKRVHWRERQGADRRVSIATASCGSPPTCSRSPPKSSHSYMFAFGQNICLPLDHRDLLSTAHGGGRQFKHLLGCRHLLSHNQNGIERFKPTARSSPAS